VNASLGIEEDVDLFAFVSSQIRHIRSPGDGCVESLGCPERVYATMLCFVRRLDNRATAQMHLRL